MAKLLKPKNRCCICERECGRTAIVCIECWRDRGQLNLDGLKKEKVRCSICGNMTTSKLKICQKCSKKYLIGWGKGRGNPSGKILHRCENCNAPIKNISNPPKRYCSNYCKNKIKVSDKVRKHGPCMECGGPLMMPSKRKRLKYVNDFCTPHCQKEYYEKHPELWDKCKTCGKKFNPHRISRAPRKSGNTTEFCGKVCYERFTRNTGRKRINRSMSKRVGEILRAKGLKECAWHKLVPWTEEDVYNRLMQTLPDGYTEDDIGPELHVDHIVPVNCFSFSNTSSEEFFLCWLPENLQLLPAFENLSKQDKYLGELGETVEDAKNYLRLFLEDYDIADYNRL